MTASTAPNAALVQRFAADLDALVEPGGRVGLAVSGGPDSLALLILAAAARPGMVEAATVDHGLRPESRAEAEMVARLCTRLGVGHAILATDAEAPSSNLQAWARELRYDRLLQWAGDRQLDAVATAHHVDDQAETLLMRAARGSGVGGLAGAQRHRLLGNAGGGVVFLVRPLLGWRRSELRQIVHEAGLQAVDDPSNSDERFDRSRARALLETTDWLDPHRLASAAAHCRDAERALEWAARKELEARLSPERGGVKLDAAGLPYELKRRLLLAVIERMTGETPPGPKLVAALEALDAGGMTTLAGLKLEGGVAWRLSAAPPRKHH